VERGTAVGFAACTQDVAFAINTQLITIEIDRKTSHAGYR